MKTLCTESHKFHDTEIKTAEKELNLKNYLQRVLWRRMAKRQANAHKKPLDMFQWIDLYSDAFQEFYQTHRSFFGEPTRFNKRESYVEKIMVIEMMLYKRRW